MANFLTILVTIILIGSVPDRLISQIKPSVQAYIDQFSPIAVSEMHRTGIPASIKLAQGILESGLGKSELAKNANNHFGIKCGKDWTGETYALEDDDFDTCGALLKSCFRKYSSAEESYIAHSEFLRNPAKNTRYGFLFSYSPTDYKSWAYGLKSAGYATNPKYADQLIKTIEDNQLSSFDQLSDEEILVFKKSEVIVPPSEILTQVNEDGKINQIIAINDVKTLIVNEGQSLKEISKMQQIKLSKLKDYNQHILFTDKKLPKETRIYLKPLRKAYHGDSKWHYVQKGETMQSIAWQYAVKEEVLRKRNHLATKEEPSIGEKIALRGWKIWIKKPSTKTKNQSILPDKPPVQPRPDQDHVIKENKPEIATQYQEGDIIRYHLVESGDTLFGLARKYGVSVSQIKTLNRLDDDKINLGQRLRVN